MKKFFSEFKAFALKGGYWKGIRTGLFCYGESGQAQFDYYRVEL